jgi:lipopolysaccharide/colanic/teichoic acid biosynthesis glycosyltransferase
MLIIASPLLIFTSILIKVTSKGPVIFSQRRIGKNGKPFDFYKFRSMIHNGKKDSEREKEFVNFINDDKQRHNYKVLDEDKVTRVGKIIRKTSIDELPQLFNVIKGDMSLVGPRPCLPYEFNHYQSWQRKRVEVMPGCTGLWQVFGRNSVSFVDSMKMDIYYIYKMSFLTDLEYMIKTIPVILLAKGE